MVDYGGFAKSRNISKKMVLFTKNFSLSHSSYIYDL